MAKSHANRAARQSGKAERQTERQAEHQAEQQAERQCARATAALTSEANIVERLGWAVALEERSQILPLHLELVRRAVRQRVEGVHLIRVGERAHLVEQRASAHT